VNYWLRQVDEYSIHSPFVFDIYQNIFNTTQNPDLFRDIEFVRNKMENDDRSVSMGESGSASKISKKPKQRVSTIAKSGITKPKYSELLYRLCVHAEARMIVELGTSIGINTMYLAQVPRSNVITFEGAPEIADVARENFSSLDKANIKLIEGNLDVILKHKIDLTSKIDFAYIDANHRKQATLDYFKILARKTHDKSFIAIDDIHRSKEMRLAWKEIVSSPLVKVSIDICEMGIVYFDPDLSKQHYVLSF